MVNYRERKQIKSDTGEMNDGQVGGSLDQSVNGEFGSSGRWLQHSFVVGCWPGGRREDLEDTSTPFSSKPRGRLCVCTSSSRLTS